MQILERVSKAFLLWRGSQHRRRSWPAFSNYGGSREDENCHWKDSEKMMFSKYRSRAARQCHFGAGILRTPHCWTGATRNHRAWKEESNRILYVLLVPGLNSGHTRTKRWLNNKKGGHQNDETCARWSVNTDDHLLDHQIDLQTSPSCSRTNSITLCYIHFIKRCPRPGMHWMIYIIWTCPWGQRRCFQLSYISSLSGSRCPPFKDSRSSPWVKTQKDVNSCTRGQFYLQLGRGNPEHFSSACARVTMCPCAL